MPSNLILYSLHIYHVSHWTLSHGIPLPNLNVSWGMLSQAVTCPIYLSKEGFSPQSNASWSSLTRLAWPGSRKRPSSFSPRCLMKSTHCSTSMGASRFPYLFSYRTVSSSFCPKIPGKIRDHGKNEILIFFSFIAVSFSNSKREQVGMVLHIWFCYFALVYNQIHHIQRTGFPSATPSWGILCLDEKGNWKHIWVSWKGKKNQCYLLKLCKSQEECGKIQQPLSQEFGNNNRWAMLPSVIYLFMDS